ncbi:WecB/TagA/CpsF family glycosyltransferase [Deinococcus sp.]|uniref:WecB/TagA/CpsF family glycosyltransferase n=1 Tax=Deinococcus sp. TaxID=47478 RepID=UPI0025F500A1|nr:WecB/TagA/CpsF family glycosyltransferase [Deinococcus sp.]
MTGYVTKARLLLLGLPLDSVTLSQALDRMDVWLAAERPRPHTVVTLNPEFIMQARAEDLVAAGGRSTFTAVMQRADLVTADGVGIVWAAKQLLDEDVPRAPGFDLATGLMERHGDQLRVFFLGAKPGVAEIAAQKAHERYGVVVAGTHHGYFAAHEDQRVAELVGASKPHLLLCGMGAGRQEIFCDIWSKVLGAPVMLGCGGVIDVLAGTAALAPDWTRKLGVEWVWRVAGDRKRWGRAPRLARFVALVRSEGRRTQRGG